MRNEITIQLTETKGKDIKVEDIYFISIDNGELVVIYKDGKRERFGKNADIYLEDF